jgi:hypothetical protein
VAWFECHFELGVDQFEAVALVLLVPHALVQFDLMGLLTMELLAVGACILLWLVVFVLLLFSAAALQLGTLGFLGSRAHGLRSSLDKFLSKLTPYADSVYAELVSSPIMA